MAVLLSSMPESSAEEALPHKLWTRDELAILESTGIFDGTHFELIGGELIDKMGKKRRHVWGTRYSAETLERVFGRDFVDREAPIDVAPGDRARNEPEPDVVVLRYPSGSLDHTPLPTEVLLVLEVADSTLSQDLQTKAELYARAGIVEYWVLDVKNRKLHVLRDPTQGDYRTRLEFGEHESVAPLEKPSHSVAVADLLPRA